MGQEVVKRAEQAAKEMWIAMGNLVNDYDRVVHWTRSKVSSERIVPWPKVDESPALENEPDDAQTVHG